MRCKFFPQKTQSLLIQITQIFFATKSQIAEEFQIGVGFTVVYYSAMRVSAGTFSSQLPYVTNYCC